MVFTNTRRTFDGEIIRRNVDGERRANFFRTRETRKNNEIEIYVTNV